jgi:DNA polymerase-3 subunit delta'
LNPIETKILLSQDSAQDEFLRSFKSGSLHHSLLITGEAGVGKATFAYRAARYIFAHNNPGGGVGGALFASASASAPSLDLDGLALSSVDDEAEESGDEDLGVSGDVPARPVAAISDGGALALPPSHPVYERMLAGAVSDFKVLEREYVGADRAKRRTEITVEQVRSLKEFFSTTSSEGGYRVALIDSADEMSASAQNALLKLLEEPPSDSVVMLVCHNPGLVLDTIRSRCRKIRLGRIGDADMQALIDVHLPGLAAADRDEVLRFARGSIGRAIRFHDSGGPAIAAAVASGDTKRLAAIVTTDDRFEIFAQVLSMSLDGRIKADPDGAAFKVRDAVRRRLGEARLNLDRTALVISLMHMVGKC